MQSWSCEHWSLYHCSGTGDENTVGGHVGYTLMVVAVIPRVSPDAMEDVREAAGLSLLAPILQKDFGYGFCLHSPKANSSPCPEIL